MNGLDTNEVQLNNHDISSLSPELSFSPFSRKLFLQENSSLTMLPPSLFQRMPVLHVLNLSHTSIQSLPSSISRLYSLKEFILRECSLLMEVPPEIGALKNLKLFDLEGTEIMYVPKEIGKLKTLECLRVSLSTYADEHKERYGVEHIIPRMTIFKLTKLKELSISVNPEAEWWGVELSEAIMGDLLFLADLKTLKLYLPTAKALQQFLRLERYRVPIYSSLWDYRFMIGHCEQLPLSVQLDIEENFLKLEKCVKYMNGERYTSETVELIKNARALYLRRHWTIEKLSMFDVRNLKYCLLMECHEMQTVVDHEDLCKHKDKFTNHSEDEIFGSMQYLSMHIMKKLKSISKGPNGKNRLSCLRILALHTCPELTSIFTGCLLNSMQSLTELIVEDCPKVNSLVKMEDGTPQSNGPFLLNLRRVSLLDLPELVSISSGVCIAPQLDTLIVFNCMKLDYLSVMEIPRVTKAIKGEIEWWDALKYGKMTWHGVFVQLKRDGDLMDKLAEDTNSLQHFFELEMVPSHPGSSLQVDQKLLGDHHLGCNLLYTKEEREHVDLLQIDLNVPSSHEALNSSTQKILNSNNKAPNHKSFSMKKKCSIDTLKQRVYVSKGVEVEKALDDGYIWRKYGQKEVLYSLYPRMYYRCSFNRTHGCCAKKHVQRSTVDSSLFEVCYSGMHTCPTVTSGNRSSAATKLACRPLGNRDTLTETESASTITDSHFKLPTSPQVLDADKKGYYRNTSFNAEKQVLISDDGVPIWSFASNEMYTAQSSVTSHSTSATESASTILKNRDSSTATKSALEILRSCASSTAAESTSTITDNSFGLDSTQIMSGSASGQSWKQQVDEIQSSFYPSIQLQLSLSINSKPNHTMISDLAENSSRNLPSSIETAQNAKHCPAPVSKAKKEKLGDRMTALHQLVSPFGKTDTASVLLETCEYIRFLHQQVSVLAAPYIKQGAPLDPHQKAQKQDLRSKGLCLVPVSSIFPIVE